MKRMNSGPVGYVSVGRKIFNISNAVFLFIVSMVVLIPLLMVIVTSLSPDAVVAREEYVLIPRGLRSIIILGYSKVGICRHLLIQYWLR